VCVCVCVCVCCVHIVYVYEKMNFFLSNYAETDYKTW